MQHLAPKCQLTGCTLVLHMGLVGGGLPTCNWVSLSEPHTDEFAINFPYTPKLYTHPQYPTDILCTRPGSPHNDLHSLVYLFNYITRHNFSPTRSVIIGASLSEPHTDEFAVNFPYIYLFISCRTSCRKSFVALIWARSTFQWVSRALHVVYL